MLFTTFHVATVGTFMFREVTLTVIFYVFIHFSINIITRRHGDGLTAQWTYRNTAISVLNLGALMSVIPI